LGLQLFVLGLGITLMEKEDKNDDGGDATLG